MTAQASNTRFDQVATGIVGQHSWQQARPVFIYRSIIFVAWLGVCLVLLYTRFSWYSLLWLAGSLLGWFIIDIDHLIDLLWIHTSGVGKYAWNCIYSGNLKKLLELSVTTADHRPRLLSRSVVFHFIMLVLALTSLFANSLFVSGFVLAILGRISTDQIWDYAKADRLNRWWWQFRGTVPPQIQAVWMITGALAWIGLTGLAVFA